jgi:hypothetical protein
MSQVRPFGGLCHIDSSETVTPGHVMTHPTRKYLSHESWLWLTPNLQLIQVYAKAMFDDCERYLLRKLL